jgi:hypothetical protein
MYSSSGRVGVNPLEEWLVIVKWGIV